MPKKSRPWFYYFANRALRFVFGLILDIDIRGTDDVPSTGPLIVAISHSSFLDPVLVGAYLPRDVTPMAKIEAFQLPVIGWVIRWYGAFPVRRGEVDLTAFKTALQILSRGDAIIIAPEGHRSESGALQHAREGAIILSLRSGAPILPVAVWGGKAFWQNLTHLRRTKIWLYMGEAVEPLPTGLKPTRERISEMSDELMTRIAEMMPPDMRGYYADIGKFPTGRLQPSRGFQDPLQPARGKEAITR